MTSFRFYITRNSVVTEVFPLGDWKFIFDKGKDQAFFRHKISGKFVFSDRPNESVTDYTYFKNIEDTAHCEVLDLLVTRICNGTASNYFRGTFGTVDGEWDLDRCTFEVEPLPQDLSSCVNVDTPVNILNITNTVTVYQDSTVDNRTYTRCRLFDAMLLYVAQQSCPDIKGVVSDFFQINPETASSFNYVTNELNTYTKMCVSHKSDVKEPIPTNAAVLANTSFKKISGDLIKLFNVYWFIDANDNIRFEHLNYFSEGVGLDLTAARYTTYMAGTRKYKYSRVEMPAFEQWSCVDSGQGFKITYGDACGNIESFGAGSGKGDESVKFVKYEPQSLFVDFYRLRYNPVALSNLDGIMLFATKFNAVTGNYDMLGFFHNEELILGKLVLRFHKWGRPNQVGVGEYFPNPLDGIQSYFGRFLIYNEKKNKEQEQITIPMCCDDVFDESKTVKTSLGTGEIKSAEYDPFRETMNLSLKYGATDISQLSPSDIGNLLVWLKADVGVTEVLGVVSSWADQSGNNYHATQATAGFRPVKMTTAGKNFIRFDGVDDCLVTPSFQMYPNQRGSIFIVARTRIDDRGIIVGSYSNGAGKLWDIGVVFVAPFPTNGMRYNSFAEPIAFAQNFQIAYAGAYSKTQNDFVLFEAIRSTDNLLNYWIGGRAPGAITLNPAAIAGLPASNPMNIGNDNGGGAGLFAYDGDIAEIIIFNKALSEIERQHVEQYLFRKYQFINSYMG